MVNIKLVILYLSMCALPATSEEIAWHIQNNDRNVLLIRRQTAISAEYNVHPDHSCYEAILNRNSSTLRFCYPSVIISGIPKAGTSASYELLKEHPSFDPGPIKENCMTKTLPYSDDALWKYFKTLAKQTEAASKMGGKPKRLLSGCISITNNLKLHEILRHPNTLYLLMTRDLSDLMWATYNFWCSPKYDGEDHCNQGRWADAQYHYRSPTLFHELLVAQVEGKKQYGMGPLHHDICDEKSAGFYRDYENQLLGAGIEVDRILFIANEELSSNASSVWNKLTRAIGIVDREEKKHPSLKKFETFRVNTGDHKGSLAHTSIGESYQQGIYKISKYKPILNDTRNLISRIWKNDCLWTSHRTGFPYKCAHNVSL